jgi:hypothetical protein
MMLRIFALAGAAAFVFALPARAQEQGACMAEVPVTAALVAETAHFDWRGQDAHGAAPALLVGMVAPELEGGDIDAGAPGGIVFVREAGGAWRAFQPAEGEAVVGAFTAPSSGALVLVSQLQHEGPGQSWTITRADATGAHASCTEVPFPAELNQPDWENETLALVDLDIKKSGRGEAIGAAEVTREGVARTWRYIYRTRDGGASWDGPERLARMREPRPGLYDAMDQAAPAPAALVDALAAYAANR